MNIYRNIDRAKVQFDFIKHTAEKCDFDEEITHLGGKIYTISRYNGKNHFDYIRQWKTFFTEHAEHGIIHGHMRSTASIYLSIAKQFGLVTIAHSHSTASRGNFVEKCIKDFMQFPIRYKADYLLACSNNAGEWLFGKRALKRDNYKFVKNGIDIKKYSFNEVKRNEVRRKLNMDNKFVVGHVGSFTYPKNHNFLIEVFNYITKTDRDAVLLLLGDGVLRGTITKQLEYLGITERVVLAGNVSNANDYLQAMDVFAFPSIFEGLGISLVEAQASGLPCIVSNNVPSEALIADEIRVLKLDIELWAKNILSFKNYTRVRISPSSFVNDGYDIRQVSREIVDFYLEALGG